MVSSSDAIYNPHLRLTFGGTIGEPAVEQWTNGFRLVDFDNGAMPNDETLQRGANAIAEAVQLWFTSNDMRIGNAAKLGWLKLNRLDAKGLQPGETIRHDFPAGVTGSFATNPDWNQTFAMTLRTNKSRGRAHAGRIFPPLIGYNPEGKTPYIDAVAANIMATATKTMLDGIITALRAEWTDSDPGDVGNFVFAIVSPGSVAAATPEVRAPVRAVVVDRVPDTQHRRTKQVQRLEGNPAVLTNVP